MNQKEIFKKKKKKNHLLGARGMAEWLKALTDLPEDLG